MPIENNDFGSIDTEEAARKALTRIGLKTMQVAMPNCPVQSGNLRRSHKYKVDASAGYVDVGVTAEYGGYVHNGTSKQKAQPWLRDAVEANKASIMEGGINAYKMSVGGGA